VLRKLFGAKRDEVTGEWRRLHNEELNYWNSPPSDKKTRMRWAVHVARMGSGKCIPVSVGNLKEREHLD
jgi:hypothetical protein